MEQLFYWLGGIGLTVVGYFVKSTIDDLKKHKEKTDMEIEKLKENSAINKGKIEVLENDHNNKYNHLSQKLDEVYQMLRDLIIEVKDINKRMK